MNAVQCVLGGIPQNLIALIVLCAFALVFWVLAFLVGTGTLDLTLLKDVFSIQVPVGDRKKMAQWQKTGQWIFLLAGVTLFVFGIIGVPWAAGPCSRPSGGGVATVTSSQATATAVTQAHATATAVTQAQITATAAAQASAAQVPLSSRQNISEGRSQACIGSGEPVFDFEAQTMTCFVTPDIAWNQQRPTVEVALDNVRLATIPSSDVSAGWDSITLDRLRSYDYSQTSLKLNVGQMFAVLTHFGHHVKVQVTGISGLIDPGYSGLTYTFTYVMYR
jgi:hypothetical protein